MMQRPRVRGERPPRQALTTKTIWDKKCGTLPSLKSRDGSRIAGISSQTTSTSYNLKVPDGGVVLLGR